MNKIQSDIIKYLYLFGYSNQREISSKIKYSLGTVNKNLKILIENGFVDKNYKISKKTIELIEKNKPRNAIILADNFEAKSVISKDFIPNCLLKINGEIMIERIINQLKQMGINEICIITGFMKEKFEYLIDEFSVELIYNKNYKKMNSIYSLNLVDFKIDNTYIIPSNVWCYENPFSDFEISSWYMVTDKMDSNSNICVNKNNEISTVKKVGHGNKKIGISYICNNDYLFLINNLRLYLKKVGYYKFSWEETLKFNKKYHIQANIISDNSVFVVDTYEQFKDLNTNANELNIIEINTICSVFDVNRSNIKNIVQLKKGMTNKSFIFSIFDKKYIMRVPGVGTDKFIDRENEYCVYKVIKNFNLSDEVIYIDSQMGYKITKYITGARTCDSNSYDDLKICMKKLKELHNLNLKVKHEFKILEEINKYERFFNGVSMYKDYINVKNNIIKLNDFVRKIPKKMVLSHVDSIADNFLIDGNKVYLIDWEYSAMCDPHIDLAMFCIYSYFDLNKINEIIDIYFENKCEQLIRVKIYCYVAMCGLLWSNWCEYKMRLGVNFGEYSVIQYRYAKKFYKIACEEINKLEGMNNE